MNINFLLLYCGLSLANVVIQTIKSLCTIKCSTFISACVNALAYGLYVFVIFYTNAEGLSLWGKAFITAAANFSGVYIANLLFSKMFDKEVRWKIEVSVPNIEAPRFVERLTNLFFEYYESGHYGNEYTCYTVFSPNKNTSVILRGLLDTTPNAKYNVSECVKRL